MRYTPDHKIFDGNKLVGYVENETLYGIRNGYAEPIGPVEHQTQAVAALQRWMASNNDKA